MLRYAWQNPGYDIGEPVDNFTSVIDVSFINNIIECSVMTRDHLAFLQCAFCSHSYCFEYFIVSPHLYINIVHYLLVYFIHYSVFYPFVFYYHCIYLFIYFFPFISHNLVLCISLLLISVLLLLFSLHL